MTSRMSHLVIGDILAVGVALRKGPALVDRLGDAKQVVAQRRVAVRY